MTLRKEKKDFIIDKKDKLYSLRKLISMYSDRPILNKSADHGHCVQRQDHNMQWNIESF